MPFPTCYRLCQRAGRIGFLLLLCTGGTAVLADTPREQWHAQLTESYAALAASTSTLHDRAKQQCLPTEPTSVATLQGDWLTAFLAWQQVRFIDFGPIEQNSMAWQFQFWPDSKNLVARQG